MSMTYPETHVATAGATVQSALLSFPIACFTLALLTDLAYWASANLMWQNFSSWLLFAGLVGGGLSIVGWIVRQAIRPGRTVWPAVIVNIVVLVVAFFNSLVHAGDGWTAIVPWGIALSALTVLFMLVSGFLGRTTIHR